MVTTVLFAGIIALLLCFFTMIAEEFIHDQKRRAVFSSKVKRSSTPSDPDSP